LTEGLTYFAKLPVVLIFTFALLFNYLGLSFFSGIAIIILAVVTNIFLGKVLARVQKTIMKSTDDRMKLTTESFNNIKMLKLYNW
jgi:ABC-type bacteriocin/lantibiotic exporter with double-glycine peptidase domain